MRRFKLKLELQERKIVFLAIRATLQRHTALNPAHGQTSANNLVLDMLSADLYGSLNFAILADPCPRFVSWSLRPYEWASVYCALWAYIDVLDTYGNDSAFTARHTLDRIFKIITRPIYE